MHLPSVKSEGLPSPTKGAGTQTEDPVAGRSLPHSSTNMLGLRWTSLELLSAWFCHLTFSAGQQHGSDVVRVVVRENDDAVLPCTPWPERDLRNQLFDWKKDGRQEVFLYYAGAHYNNGRTGQDPQFTGRVFHFPEQLKTGDASITIGGATVADSGVYTCVFPHLQPHGQTCRVSLVVEWILKAQKIAGAAPQPHIRIINTDPNVLQLQCEVQGAFPKPQVELQDSAGHVLPAEQTVSEMEGRYDVTTLATITKSGLFRCVVTQQEIHHTTAAETYVPFFGDALEPRLRKPDAAADGLQLECEVRGAFPKTEVELQDGAGNALPAEHREVVESGGRYYINALATVTKGDHFRCVVTQQEINHVTEKTHVTTAEAELPLSGAASQPHIRILNATADGARLQCEVHDAFPKPKVELRDGAGNVLPAETTQVSERGGRYDVTALATVTKADTVRCVVTQQEINHVTAAETYVPFSENVCEDSAPEVHIGWWFVRLVLGAFLLIAVVLVLVATKCIQMHLN